VFEGDLKAARMSSTEEKVIRERIWRGSDKKVRKMD